MDIRVSLSPRPDVLAAPARAPLDRRTWAERYDRVRRASLDLTDGLTPEDQQIQSMPDASPTKWHLAHTTWFFETFLLRPFLADYSPLDERYAYLFNSYYEAVGERHPRPDRGLLTRPSLTEVLAYRAHVDAAVARLIKSVDLTGWADLWPLIDLGLNHEQQHQELILMDIKHAFSRNPLRPALRSPAPEPLAEAPAVEWLTFGGALCEIGHDGQGFAFDNEGPRHKVWLEPYRIADRLVTEGEYLNFMLDGGYERPELWLSDGWSMVGAQGWNAPLYWRETEAGWVVFTLSGERPLNPAAPVCHLSLYEADAYAHWADARLPTEAEWEWAAASSQGLADGALLDSGRLHPAPAPRAAGLKQLNGDVWEWTASAYLPYSGFKPPAGAIGEYNGKFMSGQMVLRGASCATPADHTRQTYRNFFPPHARWAFSGLRLAKDATS